jgi:hypothetical protein
MPEAFCKKKAQIARFLNERRDTMTGMKNYEVILFSVVCQSVFELMMMRIVHMYQYVYKYMYQ